MNSLQTIIISLPAVLLALSVHEFAHGYVAYRLGDPTPKYQGRLTLNPLAHLDLIGTLMLIFFRFGWAKPVMVNPANFRMNQRKGMLYVALAGPVSNILVALIAAILYNLLIKFQAPYFWIVLAEALLVIDIFLAIFNLIPIPPLDGSKVLAGLLPGHKQGIIYQLEAYGPFILIFLIITNIIGKILGPLVNGLLYFVMLISHFIVG
ncbi:MAG TPA: site-2 protease family protein [Clostridia bacterium]|jgi:Zn-dependent protease|nr:site-2 protease family protein [Clostridia bacterium]